MTAEQWASVKALYFEARAASGGAASFLSTIQDIDDEVMSLVRGLLSEDNLTRPELDRPCWIPLKKQDHDSALRIGDTLLDRFEIVGFLGAGGMGEVYRVFDHDQAVFVALKTLRPALAGDPLALRSLRNELNMARMVSSPFICRLHEIHSPDDGGIPPFFTMQLLEGETLAHYLRRQGPMPPDAVLPLAGQMISALEAAHSAGVVHRDFKTANVMLLESATRAVVMDFGLAREISPGASLEVTIASAAFAGTPAYMAPEQLRGQRATFASDIHGLGVVLFEMLTGRRPFEGDGPLEIASRRLREDAPSPRHYVSGLDRRWEYVVLRCLEAAPDRRPSSAAAVRELLHKSPPFFWQRRRLLLGAAAAIPLSVAGGGWWAVTRQRSAVAVDVFDMENQTGDRSFDFLCRGTTSELIRRFAQSNKLNAIAIRDTFRASPAKSKSRFLLSGVLSGQKEAPRLEVRIVDKSDAAVVWSKRYEGKDFGDLLRLQEDIAQEATAQLIGRTAYPGGQLLASWFPESSAAGEPPTVNGAAFDAYIRGTSLQQESTEESFHAAIGLFEKAVSIDPHFALALAALADCHLSLLNYGDDDEGAIAAKARDYAQRAVREGPSVAEAHMVMGAVYQLDWDWLASESEYDQALALKPAFARALRWRAGLVLQFARFDEAIAAMEKAHQIDPYDRPAVSTYGMALLYAGRFSEAAAMMEREIGNRDMTGARFNTVLAYAMLAKHSGSSRAEEFWTKAFAQMRAITAIENRSSPPRSILTDRLHALLYSMRGQYDRAAPYLEKLERQVNAQGGSPAQLASIYAAQHRVDEALTALERGAILKDRLVLYLRVNVLLEDLRGTPRFEALLRTLRLKQ